MPTLSSHEETRFRITTWPTGRLPHPALYVPSSYRIGDGVLLPSKDETPWRPARGQRAGEPELVFAVEEIYLELAFVDLEKESAILDFAKRFRTLGIRSDNFAAFEDFPRFQEHVRPQLEAVWPAESVPGGLRLDESLEDFRFGARCIRDLITAWTLVHQDAPQEPQWESLPEGERWIDPDTLALYAEQDRTPGPKDEASEALSRLLNPALYPFQPKILPGSVVDPDLPGATAPLYTICCLELFNHITEGATYRRCPYRGCGRLFVRQKGRAETGQYRSSGTRYCSAYCAKAETQRKYRERNRP